MLSEKHAKGIEARGLCLDMAAVMGAYSARRLRDGSIEADIDGNILALPFMEYDQEVNTKYRWSQDGDRRFQQRKDAKKTLYNANVLLNDDTMNRLEAGTDELIWTEGEFDCWAVLMTGLDTCVSVPDGAPPARDKNGKLIEVPDDDRDIDPEDDDKFAFMGRLMDPIMKVKHHIIATDGDEPGGRLAKELVRRIGAAKCFWVEYPKDEVVPDKKRPGKKRAPKDMNEVLLYLGQGPVPAVGLSRDGDPADVRDRHL